MRNMKNNLCKNNPFLKVKMLFWKSDYFRKFKFAWSMAKSKEAETKNSKIIYK